MSTTVDDEVGLDVRGFGVWLDQEFLWVDVEGDGLEVVDDGFERSVGLLFLHWGKGIGCLFVLIGSY